jgi:hypothetical protein
MPNEKELMQGAPTAAPKEPLTPGGEDTPNKPADKPKDDEAANRLLEQMMYSPTSGDADPMIEIDKTTDEDIRDTKIKPEAEELLKILEKGEGEISEKYRKELLDKALKDPTSVEVETPRGWMSVKDAIGEGFDLTTGDFTNEAIPKVDWEGEISKLDPREQETIRKLTKPGTRQAGPSKPAEAGGDVIPGATGEPLPEQAQGAPIPEGAMGGTDLALGGV